MPKYLQKPSATMPSRMTPLQPSPPLANTVIEDMQLRSLYPMWPPSYHNPYPAHLIDGGVMARLNSHYRFPSWDGRPETWKTFAREWESSCRVHAAPLQNPTMKTLIFIECVPPKYQSLFKTWWADSHCGFPEMWSYIVDYVDRNLSSVQEIQNRDNLKPKGRTLENYMDWYRDFVKMGNDLREGVITE